MKKWTKAVEKPGGRSLWLRIKSVGKDCSGAGVIELLLIIVGILTP